MVSQMNPNSGTLQRSLNGTPMEPNSGTLQRSLNGNRYEIS